MTNTQPNIFQNKIVLRILWFLAFLLVFFPVFTHLDTLPIRVWDEARNALNAYEMSKNGKWFVTYYEGNPDLWNTKPPLLIWFQVFWINLIGFNEVAIRIPSAIASFLTLIAVYQFVKFELKSHLFAFVPVFILITSTGFLGEHSGRTGDYDALLTLFTTCSAICFYRILHSDNRKYFYWFFIFLSLGALTKGVASLLFLPAYFVLSLIFKRFYYIVKNPHFYAGILMFLSVVLSIYMLREMQNPGYLKAVYENELGGRFMQVTENHKAGFWYYYENFYTRFEFWMYFLPCGILFGLLSKNAALRKLAIFSLTMALGFFLVISKAQTKLAWYDVPMYPFLAMLTSYFIYLIFQYLKEDNFSTKHLTWNILPWVFLFLIFVKPYQTAIFNNYIPNDKAFDFNEFSHFLKKDATKYYEKQNNVIFHDEYYAHVLFYLHIHQDLGYDVVLKDLDHLQIGDVVFTSTFFWGLPKLKPFFEYEILYKKGRVLKIRLTNNVKIETLTHDESES